MATVCLGDRKGIKQLRCRSLVFRIELWWNSKLSQALNSTQYSKDACVLSGERSQRPLSLGTWTELVLPVWNKNLDVCQGTNQNGRNTFFHTVPNAHLEYNLKQLGKYYFIVAIIKHQFLGLPSDDMDMLGLVPIYSKLTEYRVVSEQLWQFSRACKHVGNCSCKISLI